MVRAILERKFDYVLERERVDPDHTNDTDKILSAKAKARAAQTVFHLQILTAKQSFRMTNSMGTINARNAEISPKAGDQTEQALLAGLCGWSNFKGVDPETQEEIDVQFEREPEKINVLGTNINPPKQSCLDYLGSDDLAELSEAIQNGSTLTVGQAGN
jgi:hypothetical protein